MDSENTNISNVDFSSDDSIADANFNISNCTVPSSDSENEVVSFLLNLFVIW